MLTQKDFLLNISYSRNTKSNAKVICFLLVILSIHLPVYSQSAPTCDYATNPKEVLLTQIYCSPKGGEEYEIGQVVNLSWNPSNARLFGSDDDVEVYLFRKRQNATAVEELVVLDSTEYLISSVKDNSMNFTVESRWLPDYSYSTPSENEKHTFIFRVIPKGSDNKLNKDFSSPDFFVLEHSQEPVSNSTTNGVKAETAPTPTPTNLVSASIDSKAQKKDKSENSAFIAFITVASIAAFLAFTAIVISVRSKKRNNNQTKDQSLSNLSASSSTPMISVGKFGNSNHDSESPAEAESIHSTTPLANKEELRSKPKPKVSFSNENQPISASDAALLSDAFRKVLRKPDWKPEDEEDDDTNLSQEERLRRREAKELMKKELAEEGTDLQNISRRHTKVEIRNVSDELEKDGVSRSSESGPK